MLARTVTRMALCCLALASRPAGAQPAGNEPNAPRVPAGARGLMLGLTTGMANTTIAQARSNGLSGPLVGARLGWGVSRRVSVQLNMDVSAVEVDSAGAHAISHTDLTGRYIFALARKDWAPYIDVGVGRRYIRVDDHVDPRTGVRGQLDAHGVGPLIGVGLQTTHDTDPSASAEVGIRLVAGRTRSTRFEWVPDDGITIDALSVRLTVAVNWHPMARRYRR